MNKFKLLTSAISIMAACSAEASSRVCQMTGGLNNLNSSSFNQLYQGSKTATNYQTLVYLLNQGTRKIYIPGNTVIRVPNQRKALELHSGQTVFSDRGINHSQGAQLLVNYINDEQNDYPVIVMNSQSRISGLRIQGPTPSTDSNNQTIGIQFAVGSDHITVDNNEIYYWPWAGISVKQSLNNLITANYIHDNIKSGLGYGVVVQNGNAQAEISCNVFDANRHDIAGRGLEGEGYYAHNNLVLNGGERGAYHAFDMHKGSTGHGGKSITITDNIFDFGRYGTSNRSSIYLRGIPTSGKATVNGNIFTQSWNVGSQVAISGIEGSLQDELLLQRINRFNVAVNYYKQGDQCFFSYQNAGLVTQPVVCNAVSSLINAKN